MSVGQHSASDVDVDLGRLFGSLRRNIAKIAIFCVAVTVAAFILASMAAPQYRAETRILIETRESVYTRPQGANADDRPILDDEGVTSQVQVITSNDILKRVAKKFDLANRDGFDAGDLSLPGRLLVMAGLKSDPRKIPAEERVLKSFREKLEVYRVTNSRVIVVEFSSTDRQLAAEVPNAIAETYIAVQKQAKIESTTNATDWLQPEIDKLSKSVKEAEKNVADYRARSDLLIGQNNSVLSTQQLAELSSELSRVKASRAAAEAKANSVRAALDDGTSIETLPDVLASGLIQRLRERQVELRGQIADLSTTLMSNHPRIRALQSQVTGLDRQIDAEAHKVLEGLETEAQTARFREQELVAEVNKLKAESSRAGQQAVQLRALEREASAQRQLLESYLTRYREASARRDSNYLPPDARVFSRASVPSEPYFPKVLPITAAAFAASLLIMVIVTLLAELFSGRAMRPAPRAVEPIETVAMPVLVAPAAADAEQAAPEPERREADEAAQPREAEAETAEAYAWDPLTVEEAGERLIAEGTQRALFASPDSDEAAAAAVLVTREVADAGLRVILVDLTASGAASRPMLESVSFPGITNLLASEAQFSDIIRGDLYSECHIIPVGTASPARAKRALDRLPIILDSLSSAYDLVVVECGAAEVDDLKRLVGDDTVIMTGALAGDREASAKLARELVAAGLKRPILVLAANADTVGPAERGVA